MGTGKSRDGEQAQTAPAPSSLGANWSTMVVLGWVLAALLAIAVLVKEVHEISAMTWLYYHGRAYSHWMQEGPRTVEERWPYLDAHGVVLPFGVNDYRLRRRVARGSRAAKVLLVLHRTETMSAIYLAATLVFASHPPPPFAVAWTIVGYGLLAVNILTAFEIGLAFSQTGSYVTGYLRVGFDGRLTRRTAELFTFARLLVQSLLVPSGVASATCAWFGAISGVQAWYDPFYYVLATFATVGYGDMAPLNGWGKLLAVFIMLQSATLVAVVVSSVLGSGTE